MARLEVVPFSDEHLDGAAALLATRHARHWVEEGRPRHWALVPSGRGARRAHDPPQRRRAQRTEIETMVRRAERARRVDILLNNAPLGRYLRVVETRLPPVALSRVHPLVGVTRAGATRT